MCIRDREQAQKVHEVLRAALDGKHIRTSSCARCYQDGQRDMLARCIAAVAALPEYVLRDTTLTALRDLQEKS